MSKEPKESNESNEEPRPPQAEAAQFERNEVGELDVKNPPPSVRPNRRWPTEDVDQPWSIGEAIGIAMRSLRAHFFSIALPVMAASLVTWILQFGPSFALGFYIGLKNLPFTQRPQPSILMPPAPPIPIGATAAATIPSTILGALGGAFVTALLIEAVLFAVRNDAVPAGRFLRALKRTGRMLGFQVLFLVVAIVPPAIVVAPFELADARGPVEVIALLGPIFLVPAFMICFGFTPFYIVDDDVPLIQAMRKSWRGTKHYLGGLFLYCAALAPIGLLAAVPIVGEIARAFMFLGLAYAYVRATGRNNLPWVPADFATKSIRNFLMFTFGTLLVVFGSLVAIVEQLPQTRGSTFSIRETAIRAGAILTGVVALVVLLALLLPFLLDLLEGKRFTSFVAARHVRSQKSGFLTVISILSICGVALSSCALSSVVSVMGGFSDDLKRKILGNNAHIIVDTTSGTPWADYESTLAEVRKTPGVIGATPVLHGEVMASSASNLAGVIVTGIDPKSITSVIDIEHNLKYENGGVGRLDYLVHPEKLTHLPANEIIGMGPGGEPYYKGPELPGLPDDLDPSVRSVIIVKPDRQGIILGRELAKTLHVYVGDEVTLVSPLGDLGPMGVMPRTKRFRVAGMFYSGMYEYDATYVYTLLPDAQEYFATGDKISAIEIKADDAERAERVAPAVTTKIHRQELRVRDWREINKNLFSALKLERFATFIILSIAIMVASFCIVCTLLLMVTEKGKEIAILKAIGASDGSILRTFMTEGVIIGGIGTVFGVATALALCAGLSWFGLRLDPEVYYIDRLPISVSGWDFLKVAAAAFTITTLSTVYPAWAASRLRPVDGLRYE